MNSIAAAMAGERLTEEVLQEIDKPATLRKLHIIITKFWAIQKDLQAVGPKGEDKSA